MNKNENSPFLNPTEGDVYPSYTRGYARVPQEDTILDVHEIEESDIVNYVQQRRASIISVGTDGIPASFSLNRHTSRPFDGLRSVKSNASLDVGDILSSSNVGEEPETDFKSEAKVLMKYSVPLIITFLLQYSLTVASVFSVGKLGSHELGAVSLSSMTANISGYAIIQGVSTCLDTLCAQSFGRKEYNKVGLHFMRCNYLLLLCFIPMFVLWYFLSEGILLTLVGEDQAKLCGLASKYLKVLGFGLPGFILFENGKHFLQSQGVFHASTYVLAVCAPINIILNYLLVWDKTIGMGFVGAPLAVVITNYLMFVMLYSYIYFVKGYKCWPNHPLFSSVYFRRWKKMIDLSIPGVLMVEAEWLAFEIITFTASQFGTEVLAAQSIVSTSCVLLYQIPFAMSIAASTRIAWFIGAASKKAVIITTRSTLVIAFLAGCFTGIVLFSSRNFLPTLYSKDPTVIKLASKVLVIGALYQINDALSCIAAGVLRGQGRQKIGGYLNLFTYYVVALPMAFLLSLKFNLELIGLWLGMLIALFLLSVSEIYFIIYSDWDHIINECINESLLDDGSIIIDSHSIMPIMSSNQVV
ncbi:MATE efflux family protein [Yamadazyma tenuis ATCC 10573]|uniref:MATE efflux family protein n=2 Tax=Candida tenuis TaxID=2315449 RepID=G3AY37_CANTC|nr:MATE efflux family protein [Yamadazyma tenuis ATCC 10573]EGV65761.1 MATE efflux family protein [Yamadazyma tenuis ATCC 10573]